MNFLSPFDFNMMSLTPLPMSGMQASQPTAQDFSQDPSSQGTGMDQSTDDDLFSIIDFGSTQPQEAPQSSYRAWMQEEQLRLEQIDQQAAQLTQLRQHAIQERARAAAEREQQVIEQLEADKKAAEALMLEEFRKNQAEIAKREKAQKELERRLQAEAVQRAQAARIAAEKAKAEKAAQEKIREERLKNEYAAILTHEKKSVEGAEQALPLNIVNIVLSYFIPKRRDKNDEIYKLALWLEQQMKGPYIQFPGYKQIDTTPKLEHELFLRDIKEKVQAVGRYPVLGLLNRNVQSSLIEYSIKIFKISLGNASRDHLTEIEGYSNIKDMPDSNPLKCCYVAAQNCNLVALNLLIDEKSSVSFVLSMLDQIRLLDNSSEAENTVTFMLKKIKNGHFNTVVNFLIENNLPIFRLFLKSGLLMPKDIKIREYWTNSLIFICYHYYKNKPSEEMQACLDILIEFDAKLSMLSFNGTGKLEVHFNYSDGFIDNVPKFCEIYRAFFKAGKEKKEDLLCHLAEFLYKRNSLNNETVQLLHDFIFACEKLHTINNFRTSFLKKICDSNEIINQAFTERKKANLRNLEQTESKEEKKEAKKTGKRKEHPTLESDSDEEVQKPKRKKAKRGKGAQSVAGQLKAKPKSKRGR